MRVLFLHSTWESSSEYNVHRLLAETVNPQEVDSYFIWQDATHNPAQNVPPRLSQPNRTFYYDFGRDMGIKPKLSKVKRALLIARKSPSAFRFVVGKMREINPDVIYTSQQKHEIALGWLLGKLFRKPHIIHISYPVGPWLGRIPLMLIKNGKHLIACSDFVRDTALKVGVKPAQIETLHHGADVRQYAIPKNPLALRQKFGWESNTPVVTIAARLDPGKGHLLLLEAFDKVRQAMPEARLLICGAPAPGMHYDEVIKQKATELQLNDVVNFAGQRGDLPEIFAGSDVFCMPTEEDALPLVVLGAMAASLPVVACYSGGIPEMVIDGQTGLLSQLKDADALAANILELLRDKEKAERMGRAGKERAFTAFDPTYIAEKWAALLYRRLGLPKPVTIAV